MFVRPPSRSVFRAEVASQLVLPEGFCPNLCVYGHGVVSQMHARIMEKIQPTRPLTRVVYLQRAQHMTRSIADEKSLLAAVRAQLVAPFQLSVIDPGMMPLKDVQDVMASARVVFGPHGGAWGNLIFTCNSPDVHLVEINVLHGRACYQHLHHAMGSAARFWMVEPERQYPRARNISSAFYDLVRGQWRVSIPTVLAIFAYVGVASERAPGMPTHTR